ncbi:uncharacterized protein Z520_06537 [Fonsecaea multimorphosa CBS 102226]|uniref:Uncharacterized protein n=1 Tax=Fonsecaea multimorphosa CBS 102226 TaxID=1442371 RepID=A0A0D2K3K6_9EURO|nr:uncharacterized protein Z520_06537 [Fonsecaea multimorphosa CBS 102226]KIX97759.1 hypothetical protein Z520_06537 [Fonsecaea multimorphosa CBS 102226]
MSALTIPYELPSKDVGWLKRDVLLFALSIGCTVGELHFLYEFHPKFAVFPTYSIILPFKLTDEEVTDYFARQSLPSVPGMPKFDPKRGVDGERKLTIFKPLPTSSAGKSFELRSRVIGIYDKGKAGTVIETEQSIVDKRTSEVYSRAVGSAFLIGKATGAGLKDQFPPRTPIPRTGCQMPALRFRLTTRLHICTGSTGTTTPSTQLPIWAGGAILHGLYSWNAVAHGILKEVGFSNPRALREFSARFASPAKPGDTLITKLWTVGTGEDGFEDIRFVTMNQTGKPVLSNGRALLRRHSAL